MMLDSTDSVIKNHRMPTAMKREREKRYNARPKRASRNRKEKKTGSVKRECSIG
jgi:hypothetical protein